jgi:hypothetical protein
LDLRPDQAVIEKDMDRSVNDIVQPELTREGARRILENIKSYSSFSETRFKETLLLEHESKENSYSYSNVESINPDHLDLNNTQKLKLSSIKEALKNEYTELLLNQTSIRMPQLDEIVPSYQIGIQKRNIFPKYRKHLANLIKLNELLDEYPPHNIKSILDEPFSKKNFTQIKTKISKEVAPGVSVAMQFKQTGGNKIRFKAVSLNDLTNNGDFARKSYSELISQNRCNYQ